MKRILVLLMATIMLTACVQYKDGEPVENAAYKEREEKREKKAQEKADKEQAKEDENQAKIDEVEKKEQDKKDEEKAKEKEKAEQKKEEEAAIELGIKLWEAEEDGTKDFLLETHGVNGLIDVGPNNDNYSVMNAVVSDEFRLLTDEEKEYLVNEMGNSIRNLVASNFGHLDEDNVPKVSVNFIYPNQETVASQKMSGGWKIK